jgi:hypothetical protein
MGFQGVPCLDHEPGALAPTCNVPESLASRHSHKRETHGNANVQLEILCMHAQWRYDLCCEKKGAATSAARSAPTCWCGENTSH